MWAATKCWELTGEEAHFEGGASDGLQVLSRRRLGGTGL